MTIGKGKRPRDPNQLAKWIVEQSTGQAPEPESKLPVPAPSDLSQYMAAIGRKGGQIGGKPALKDDHQGTTQEDCCEGCESTGGRNLKKGYLKLAISLEFGTS